MKVFIAIKFDLRKVGTCIDLAESVALTLLKRGVVSETNPIAVVEETIDVAEVTEVVEETNPIAVEKIKINNKKQNKK